jgi:hypothetical protein
MATSGPKRLVPPRPPTDLHSFDLETTTSRTTVLYRLSHERYTSPLFFSRRGVFRFDSDTAKWGVCYLAEDIQTACLEVFADRIRKRVIDFSALHESIVWQVNVPHDLNLLVLGGANLTNIRATVQCFVSRYSLSQEWARGLMEHPCDLDGLVYTGRQSGEPCVALFGDDDPTKGRWHQSSLQWKPLGRFSEWTQFPHFMLSTRAMVRNLPPTLIPTWG